MLTEQERKTLEPCDRYCHECDWNLESAVEQIIDGRLRAERERIATAIRALPTRYENSGIVIDAHDTKMAAARIAQQEPTDGTD